MPAKPVIDAIHRPSVGRSPSKGPDSSTMKIGARKVIAEASAKRQIAQRGKEAKVAITSIDERTSCSVSRFVRQKPGPARCHANGVTTSICPA